MLQQMARQVNCCEGLRDVLLVGSGFWVAAAWGLLGVRLSDGCLGGVLQDRRGGLGEEERWERRNFTDISLFYSWLGKNKGG